MTQESALRYLRKERNRRYKFYTGRDVLIRFDGKNVTKNKALYDLTDRYGLTRHMYDCAMQVGQSYDKDVHVFAILDEVSMVFSTDALFTKFDDRDVTYISGILLQEFVRKLTDSYGMTQPVPYFGLTALSILETDARSYTAYRRALAHDACEAYYLKQHMEPHEWKSFAVSGKSIRESRYYDGYVKTAVWMEAGFDSAEMAHKPMIQ